MADQEKRGRARLLGIALLEHEQGACHEQHLAVEQAACGRPSLEQVARRLSSAAHRPGQKALPESQRCTNPAPVCGPGKRRCVASLPLRRANEPCRPFVRRSAHERGAAQQATHLFVAATAAWDEQHGNAGERRLFAQAWSSPLSAQAPCTHTVQPRVPSPNASWYAYNAYGPTSLSHA